MPILQPMNPAMQKQENQFQQDNQQQAIQSETEVGGRSLEPPSFELSASPLQQKKDGEETVSGFKGKNPISRAEFVLWLLKSKANWFKDIGLNWKSADEVMSQAAGWTNGDRPFDPITRAEAAAILLKFAGLKDEDFEGKVVYFHDVYMGVGEPWVFPVAHQARLCGLFRGTAGNMFLPGDFLDPGTAEKLIERAQNVGIRSIEEQSSHLTVIPLSQPAIHKDEVYESQRDNEFNDYNPGNNTGTHPDYMCNVTSVAMQLQSLENKEYLMKEAIAIYKDAGGKKSKEFLAEQQFEDVLIEIIRVKGLNEYDKYSLAALAGLFDSAGSDTKVFDAVDGGTDQFINDAAEGEKGKLKEALDQGKAVIMSSILYGENGHYVHLLKVFPDGILINDPYGFRLNAISTSELFLNGKASSAYSMQILDSNWDEFLVRSSHNPGLLAEMERHVETPGDQFSGELGKANFYTWEEVKRWHIGRHGTIAG